MGYYKFEFESILINPLNRSRIFISDPTEQQEKYLGRIFGIIEMEGKEKERTKIISAIRSIEDDYYEIDESQIENIDIEKHFEEKLQILNDRLIDLFNEIQFSANLRSINSVIAILHKNNLLFVQTGNIIPYLIHKSKNNLYTILNINDTLEKSQTDHINPMKFFSNIVNGNIDFSDSLFFCTPSFPEFIALEKIKKTISTLSKEGAISEFKSILSNIEDLNKKNPFCAVFVKSKLSYENEMPVSKNLPVKSLDKILATEDKTEKLLTPSIWLETKKIFKKLSSLTKNNLTYKKQSAEKQGLFSRILMYVSAALLHIVLFIKNIPTFIKNFPSKFKLITNKDFWYTKIKKVFSTLLTLLKTALYKFNRLTKINKIIISSSIALIVIFIGSLTIMNIQKTSQIENLNFSQTIDQITQKKNSAEASLIYQDEEKARKLLLESKDALSELSKNKLSKDQKNQIAQISADIEKLMKDLRHIVNIENPSVLLTFSGTFANELFLFNDKFFALNSEKNEIFNIDIASKQYYPLKLLTLNAGKLLLESQKNEKSEIFFDSNGSLFQTDLSSDQPEFKKIENINYQNNSIKDMLTYSQRLYLLDTKANQIYRHENVEGGFSSTKKNWLVDNINLTNIVSMSIDGSMYLLNNDGQVWKMTQGKKDTEFNLTQIDPAIKNPTKIYTGPKNDFIYILEPSQKRVVLFNKNGNFVKQIFSEKFTNLKDFAIFEPQKKIYLLNENDIFEIDI